MTASRVLAAVLLANLASLVLLNGFSLRTRDLVYIYPIALAAFGALLRSAHIRPVRIPYPGKTLIWAFLFLICLTFPRLPYLLEWFPGHAVLAQGDDYGRLGELVSMTMTDRYPLPHFANQDYLLSHYYTALYPMAFLKLAVPAITLKDSILAGNFIYHVLLVFSLIELAARWLPAPRAYAVFLFLCSFFGGLDWFVYSDVLFEHAEHWPRVIFHRNREISSYYTGFLWVIHHSVAFYSMLLALLLNATLRFRRPAVKTTILGMLVIGAFYSSLFASFTAFLLAPVQVLRLAKQAWRTRTVFWLTPVFLIPLFLYTNRVQKASVSWAPLHLGIVANSALDGVLTSLLYVMLTLVVDFAGIPIMLLIFQSRFPKRDRILFWTSIAFLLSTGFIESIGYNNYSMRGMFLPTAAFFYLFARYCWEPLRQSAWKPLLYVAMGLTAVSTAREIVYMTYRPLMFSTWYWDITGREAPVQVKNVIRREYATLARDSTIRYYHPDEKERQDMHKMNAEKLLRIPVEQMDSAEYELLRYPKQNWLW